MSLRLDFLQEVWRRDDGYAHVACKIAPEPEGPEHFKTTSFKWPQQRARVWSYFRDRVDTHALYWVPAIQRTDVLRAGDEVSLRWLWAEADHTAPIVDLLDPWAQLSGRPGNRHLLQEVAGVKLDYWDHWKWQAERLKHLWGVEQRQTTCRFIRVPGSFNYKPEVMKANDGRGRRVVLDREGSPITWEALTSLVRERGRRPIRPTVAGGVRASGRLPGGLRARLNTVDPVQAHRVIFRVVMELAEPPNNWTADQILEAIEGTPIHRAKLGSDRGYVLERDVRKNVPS